MNRTILCLPGLGADAALFAPLAANNEGVRVPDWPDPAGCTTTERFAERCLDASVQSGLWNPRTVIVAFSFGGQVALSMAHLALTRGIALPAGLLLVSAPRSHRALTPAFKRQSRSARLIPGGLMKWAATNIVSPRFARASGLNDEQAADLRKMAQRLDTDRFKALATLAADWSFGAAEEAALAEAGCKIAHLHATGDFVIPPPPADLPGVELIEARAHLLTWTHADAVQRLLDSLLP